MSKVRTPCPECGVMDSGREKGQICHSCKTLIAEGKLYIEMLQNIGDSRDQVVVHIPRRASVFSSYNSRFGGQFNNKHDWEEIFLTRLLDLARYLGTEVVTDKHIKKTEVIFTPPRTSTDAYYNSEKIILSEDITQMIRCLKTAASNSIKTAYKNGVNEGKHLLSSLSSGRITVDDFNDKSLRIDKRNS